MLSAGGGPLAVSMPWLLRDAGGLGLRVGGERGSIPVAAGCGAKYPVLGDSSGVARALGDSGDNNRYLSGCPSETTVVGVVELGLAIEVEFWVAGKLEVAFADGDDGSVVVVFAKDANWWPVPSAREACTPPGLPCLVPGVFPDLSDLDNEPADSER